MSQLAQGPVVRVGSPLSTRAVQVDDIHIRAGGTGRDVVAYAAVWMTPAEIVDEHGHYWEQNAPTSMDRSISEGLGRVYCLYNHGRTLSGTPSELHSVPLGRPLEIRADKKGLLTVTRYSKDPESERILEAIRSGSVTGMSYSGVFIKSDPELGPYQRHKPASDGSLTLVTRRLIALVEYGPTPRPAYPHADIVGVRSKGAGAGDAASLTPRWTADERRSYLAEIGAVSDRRRELDEERYRSGRRMPGDPDPYVGPRNADTERVPSTILDVGASIARGRMVHRDRTINVYCHCGQEASIPPIHPLGEYTCTDCARYEEANRREAEIDAALAHRTAVAQLDELIDLYGPDNPLRMGQR